jgi:GntR family histidine utilization transcriptional repressor
VSEAPALHQRIGAEISGKIRSGEWPPGFRIPFEHELTRQYGCARATVNKAVQALAAAGLVERRRRAGTFVARPRIHSAVLEIPDIEGEITRRGRSYAYELLDATTHIVDPGDPDVAALGVSVGLLDVRCRHVADGRPFAFEERVINLTSVPEAAGADFTTEAPGAWLRAHVAWTQARHQISAVNPGPVVARRLGVRTTTACLCVKRWTWRQDVGVTFVRHTFPGDAYDLVANFTPGPSLGTASRSDRVRSA